MKIVDLQIENIKRVRLAHIKPDGSTVIIGGDNGHGKSSVLDSIQMVLAGKRALPKQAVHKGAERGEIVAKLDNGLVVRRVVTEKDTYMRVENDEGAHFASPQTMLDGFYSALSFDPLAFSRMHPADQAAQLREIAGIDDTHLVDERSAIYSKRTDVNRDLHSAQARLDTMPSFPTVTEGVDTDDIIAELQNVQNKNADIVSRNNDRRSEEHYLDGELELVADYEEKIAKLRQSIEGRRSRLKELGDMESPIDTTELHKALKDAHLVNEKVAVNERHAREKKLVDELRAQANGFTEKIKALDEERRRILREGKMPVDGLGFDENGITFNGLPWEQASQAEQIRVSVAMGIAMNPQLKVLLIRDGSLLDANNLAMIEEMAADADAQVWIERVGAGEECAVVMVDGIHDGAEPDTGTTEPVADE